MNLTKSIITCLLLWILFSKIALSESLPGFDRDSFGSVVLSQKQVVGANIELELAVGNYENEPISNYSEKSVFAKIGRAVGRLDVLTDKGLYPCTAFIVSKKFILTNYHCSLGLLENKNIGATKIQASQFVAGYTRTGIEEGTEKFIVISDPVEFNKKLDYAVLEVLGNPSERYGALTLSNHQPQGGDPFWIIGHPMGEGQRISREKCKANEPAFSAGKLLHTCDTLPGNSGSPVIDAGLQRVVALHHAGSKKDSLNFAIPMSDILSNSGVLSAYQAHSNPLGSSESSAEVEAKSDCDNLYSGALEAKQCFAYRAYIRQCSAHVFAAIAESFIDEFCSNDPFTEQKYRKFSKLAECEPEASYRHNCFGSHTDESGIYTGEFQENKYHGLGRFKSHDKNTTYFGQWEVGEKSGEGEELTYINHVYVGVGMELFKKNGNLNVVSTVKGQPAETAGIEAGDLITHIDGVRVLDFSQRRVVNMIKDGAIGSSINLTLLKKGKALPVQTSMVRAAFELSSRGKFVGNFKNDDWISGGTFVFDNGNEYKGEFQNKMMHGHGTLSYADGKKYVGEFESGRMHGQGTFTFQDGTKRQGQFKNDEHVKGTIAYENGSQYTGEFRDETYHGKGVYTTASGDKYVGSFQEGKFHGQGEYTWANGQEYRGAFAHGKHHGFGTMTKPNGQRYEGSWKEGQKNGYGEEVREDDSFYKGEFKRNKREGDGTLIFRGFEYIGEFENDTAHGHGRLKYPDGNSYEGSFFYGFPHGIGTYSDVLGVEFYSGEVKNGIISGNGVSTFEQYRYIGEHKNGYPFGVGIAIWKQGQARFEVKFEALPKNWKSNTNVHQVFPVLTKKFWQLTETNRKLVQSNLKQAGFYQASIDGEWGPGTLSALTEYSLKNINTVDLRTERAASKVFNDLLNE